MTHNQIIKGFGLKYIIFVFIILVPYVTAFSQEITPNSETTTEAESEKQNALDTASENIVDSEEIEPDQAAVDSYFEQSLGLLPQALDFEVNSFVTQTLQYNSNVDNNNEEQGSLEYQLSLGVSLTRAFNPRFILAISFTTRMTYIFDLNEYEFFLPTSNFSLRYRYKNFSLTITERPSYDFLLNDLEVNDRNNDVFTNNLSVAFGWQFNPFFLNVTSSYNYQYFLEVSQENHRFEQSISIGKSLGKYSSISLVYRWDYIDVDEQNQQNQNNSEGQNLSIAWDTEISRKISLSLSLGGEYREGEIFPTYSFRTTFLLSKRLRISFSTTARTQESQVADFRYTINNTLNCNYLLTKRLAISLSSNYTFSIAQENEDEEIQRLRFSIRFSYPIKKGITPSFFYDYSADLVQNNAQANDFETHRAGVSLTIAF